MIGLYPSTVFPAPAAAWHGKLPAHTHLTQPCHAAGRLVDYVMVHAKRKASTMKTLWKLAAAGLVAATLATPAAALPPLAQEKYINDRLIAARVADVIRRGCPTIDGRIVYAWSQARALKRYAEQQGYSSTEIDAFLDSDTDKARIYAVADDYLRRNNATNADGMCRLGRDEIAKNTVTGSLLVAK